MKTCVMLVISKNNYVLVLGQLYVTSIDCYFLSARLSCEL